jgi:hypothetical protein
MTLRLSDRQRRSLEKRWSALELSYLEVEAEKWMRLKDHRISQWRNHLLLLVQYRKWQMQSSSDEDGKEFFIHHKHGPGYYTPKAIEWSLRIKHGCT